MEHTVTINRTGNVKEGFLTFTGDTTIVDALEIKKILLAAIKQVDELKVDFNGIDSADISFIQIICAANREAFLSKKKICHSGPLPDPIKGLLLKSGYKNPTGCLCEYIGPCIWN